MPAQVTGASPGQTSGGGRVARNPSSGPSLLDLRPVAPPQPGHAPPEGPSVHQMAPASRQIPCDTAELLVFDDGELFGGPDPPLLIQHNTSVQGVVADDQYAFYQVCVSKHNHRHRITIAVEPTAGDPDLYCSTDIVHPTLAHCTWISAGFGTESITLTSDHEDWDPQSSAMYISVYGRTEAAFVLRVQISVVPASGATLRGRPPP